MPAQKTLNEAIRRTERQIERQINKMKCSPRQQDKNAAFDEIERLSAKLAGLKAAI